MWNLNKLQQENKTEKSVNLIYPFDKRILNSVIRKIGFLSIDTFDRDGEYWITETNNGIFVFWVNASGGSGWGAETFIEGLQKIEIIGKNLTMKNMTYTEHQWKIKWLN